jgi:hypothetical protein
MPGAAPGTSQGGASTTPAKPEQPAFGLPPLELGGEKPAGGNAPAPSTPKAEPQPSINLSQPPSFD